MEVTQVPQWMAGIAELMQLKYRDVAMENSKYKMSDKGRIFKLLPSVFVMSYHSHSHCLAFKT